MVANTNPPQRSTRNSLAPAPPLWQPRDACHRGTIKSGDAERQEPVRRRNHENCTFCNFLDSNMTNACLVLFVVAVGLHRSYGQYAIGRNCDSTSDCHYSNAGCIKYEQCTTGVCDCAPGYRSGTIEGRSLCKKLKKIGESCDVVNDQCFDGECKGVCSCQRGKHASVDKEHCVGNLYGEKCRQKQFNIYDWSHYTCEAGKGLKCDVDTDKCVCVDGMKRVGDHCEFWLQQYTLGLQQYTLGLQQYTLGLQQYTLGLQQYTLGHQQYTLGLQQYTLGLQQYTLGLQQYTLGLQQYTLGLQQYTLGLQQYTLGLQQYTLGLQQYTLGLQQYTLGLQQYTLGLQQYTLGLQ
ncbi:hypothetical protein LSAT2_002804 [Lamellibrachia satsuma]|nr:hypothetical protein LSAT2_002804 [Lamellibrachia satsuma]